MEQEQQNPEQAEQQEEQTTQEKPQINIPKHQAYLTGKEFYEIREYEKAFDYIEHAAKKNHLEAQLFLAEMFFEGKGCEANLQETLYL